MQMDTLKILKSVFNVEVSLVTNVTNNCTVIDQTFMDIFSFTGFLVTGTFLYDNDPEFITFYVIHCRIVIEQLGSCKTFGKLQDG